MSQAPQATAVFPNCEAVFAVGELKYGLSIGQDEFALVVNGHRNCTRSLAGAAWTDGGPWHGASYDPFSEAPINVTFSHEGQRLGEVAITREGEFRVLNGGTEIEPVSRLS